MFDHNFWQFCAKVWRIFGNFVQKFGAFLENQGCDNFFFPICPS
jgi:hypothetical protein